MFLPFMYNASPESFGRKVPDTETIQRLSRRESNATPHMFLPYAGKLSSKEFERHCMRYMEENNIPRSHAALVAKAVSKASSEIAAGTRINATLRHSLHASFLTKALRIQEEDSPVLDDDKTPDILADSDDNPSWETDLLRDQVKRQHDEIEFLRSALRHLVLLSFEKKSTIQGPQESQERRNIFGDQAHRNTGVAQSLPSMIEIPNRHDCQDDHSEQMSELQSPSVIILRNRSRSTNLPRRQNSIVEKNVSTTPISSLALQNKFALLTKQASNSPLVRMPSLLSVDLLKGNDDGNMSYMKSLQLVVENRARKQRQKYSYTDMVKGEVLENKARGLNFQIHFDHKGVFVEGLYSGTIQNGLPHGKGVFRFNNRDLYIGEFSAGKMNGEGTLLSRVDSTLATYRGIFKDNVFVGASPSVRKPPSHNQSAGAA